MAVGTTAATYSALIDSDSCKAGECVKHFRENFCRAQRLQSSFHTVVKIQSFDDGFHGMHGGKRDEIPRQPPAISRRGSDRASSDYFSDPIFLTVPGG